MVDGNLVIPRAIEISVDIWLGLVATTEFLSRVLHHEMKEKERNEPVDTDARSQFFHLCVEFTRCIVTTKRNGLTVVIGYGTSRTL